MAPLGHEFVAPSELGAIKSATRSEFPLGLGGQLLSRPFGVGLGVTITNVHDGVII